MDIQQIFKNNGEWVQEKLQLAPDYFERIPKNQTPDILYIGCCDSRVIPESFMGLKEGDVFVYRNIANTVSLKDMSMETAIYFAVSQLRVNHIVICGHYDCAGVKLAMESVFSETLEAWIKPIRKLYSESAVRINNLHDEEEKYKHLVELNVLQQCKNLFEFEEVQKRIAKQDLSIHGWVYDPFSGTLKNLGFKND